MTPKLDKRTREMILEEVKRLSLSYTPEWRFQPENPDMGTALALLYGEVMNRLIEEYNHVLERNRLEFFRLLGAQQLEAGRAGGYMIFQLSKADMPEAVIPKGAGVAAGTVGYETLEEVYVSGVTVCLAKEEKQGCYLKFDCWPDHGLISILFVIKGWEKQGNGNVRWEYFGKKGWTAIEVEDGTDGLSHTGILRFAGNPDFCEREGNGGLGFFIRGCRTDGETVFTEGMEVYANAAPVQAKRPGIEGNRMPGKNHRLMQSVGYVTRIKNPDVLYGGSEAEEREQALDRNSARIRHRFRGVTPGDFEMMVYEVFPDIRKVKCFPGMNGEGKLCQGGVTVVVLQKDFMEGRHYFYRMQEKLHQYFEGKMDGLLQWEGRFWITQPVLIRIHVRAEVLVNDHSQVLEVERYAKEAMVDFLNPVEGGYDQTGWEFGRIPGYAQVKGLLQKQKGVCYVKKVWISYEREHHGTFFEIEEGEIEKLPWALPISGSHEIRTGVMERI